MGDSGSSAAYYLVYMAYAIHAGTPEFKPSDMLVGEALERYPDVTTKGCWDYAYASFLDVPAGKVLKAGWDQTEGAQRFFNASELGTSLVGGPLLVITGEADQTVPFPPGQSHRQKGLRQRHPVAVSLLPRSRPRPDHGQVHTRSADLDPRSLRGETDEEQLLFVIGTISHRRPNIIDAAQRAHGTSHIILLIRGLSRYESATTQPAAVSVQEMTASLH